MMTKDYHPSIQHSKYQETGFFARTLLMIKLVVRHVNDIEHAFIYQCRCACTMQAPFKYVYLISYCLNIHIFIKCYF